MNHIITKLKMWYCGATWLGRRHYYHLNMAAGNTKPITKVCVMCGKVKPA